MSLGHGPSIIRNGLVLHADAGNSKSYPGSGTAWNDLSGNGNTGTLVNSPGFSNNALLFSGTNQSISFGNNANIQFLGTAPYTLHTWIYMTSQPGVGSYPFLFYKEDAAGRLQGQRDGYNMFFTTQSGSTMLFGSERFGLGVGAGAYASIDASLIINRWNCFVCTYSGSTLQLYRNGLVIPSGSTGSTQSITNNVDPLIFARAPLAINTTQASVYNRALTVVEVAQNFEAQRGRFGI